MDGRVISGFTEAGPLSCGHATLDCCVQALFRGAEATRGSASFHCSMDEMFKSEASCSILSQEVFSMTKTTNSLGNARLVCF